VDLEGSPRAAAAPAGGSAPGALGRLGERLAREHLRRRGLTLVASNVRTAGGEIDIVARDGSTLVIVEVKTCRRSPCARAQAPPTPLERLGRRQRTRLRRLTAAYLSQHERGCPFAAVRLDAIGVTVDPRGRLMRLDHVEGAW
jgi:putative endonuclease